MSLTSALSALGWEKSDRKWFGYGKPLYTHARKAFARARRQDERRDIEEQLSDMYESEGVDSMVSRLESWICGIDPDDMNECGNLWVNQSCVHDHRDMMNLGVYNRACELIYSYDEHDSQFSWLDERDYDWYDDEWDCGYYADPATDKAYAFEEMERIQAEEDEEEDEDESDIDMEWRESLDDDEWDEWEDMLARLVSYDCKRDVFGNVLTTDKTLDDWHNRKVG